MINMTALERIRSKKKIDKLSMIVRQLWNREMYVHEIAKKLGESDGPTSKYLSLLRKADIVKVVRTEKARGQPRKYYRTNIEAIVDSLAEKSNLSPDEKRILLKDAFSASKAINAAPNPSATILPEGINPRLILTYPFITVILLDYLYGGEPDVRDLQKAGYNSSEIRSLQALHRGSIKCFPFPPPPKLSNEERDWFRNKENRRVRSEILSKILPSRHPNLTLISELYSKLINAVDAILQREIDMSAKLAR